MRTGVVSDSQSLVRVRTRRRARDPSIHVSAQAPELISEVKSARLLLATWGARNNERECALLQRRFGVDSVILDHVAHLAPLLRTEAQAEAEIVSVV